MKTVNYILVKPVTNNFNEPMSRKYSKYIKAIDKYGNITYTRELQDALVVGDAFDANTKINLLYALKKISTIRELTIERAPEFRK